jgi:hypothetical protein
MTPATENKCDWLNEAATHTLAELYLHLLDETKKEHPYDSVSALVALASTAMYWTWVFTEGRGLDQAFVSLHSKLLTFIAEDPDKGLFEAHINENERWPGRLN